MKHFEHLHLVLPRELFLELVDAAASSYHADETPCTPEEFAKECIESVLASRRLDRICEFA